MVDSSMASHPVRKHPLSIWALPASLLAPVHRFRRRTPYRGRYRAHFAKLLAFIYRNRFATCSQVQRRFPELLQSSRTARRQLAEMQESLGLLELIPTPSPVWPKVYGISRRGLRLLKQKLQTGATSPKSLVADRKRPEGFSAPHVAHELLITEFMLNAQPAPGTIGPELLKTERRSLVKHDAFQVARNGRASRLIPDAFFLLRHSGKMLCCGIEIDMGTMSLKQIAAKFRLYDDWFQSSRSVQFLTELYRVQGAANPKPACRVLFVGGSRVGRDERKRLIGVISEAIRLPRLLPRLWFTTISDLQNHSSSILLQPIWLAGCRIEEKARLSPRQSCDDRKKLNVFVQSIGKTSLLQ